MLEISPAKIQDEGIVVVRARTTWALPAGEEIPEVSLLERWFSFHDPRPVEVFYTKPSISWKCSSGRCGDVAVSPPKSCILCETETDQGIDSGSYSDNDICLLADRFAQRAHDRGV